MDSEIRTSERFFFLFEEDSLGKMLNADLFYTLYMLIVFRRYIWLNSILELSEWNFFLKASLMVIRIRKNIL